MSYNVCKPGGAPFASWSSRFQVRRGLTSAFLRFPLTVRGRFVAGRIFPFSGPTWGFGTVSLWYGISLRPLNLQRRRHY